MLLGVLSLGVVLGEPFEVLGVGVKLEPVWTVLGRSMALDNANRPWVGFVFLAGSILLAGAGGFGAPRRMASVGLLMLLAVTGSLMVRPFVFSPALLAAAAITGSLLVARVSGAAGRAPGRLLTAYVMAMMAILIAGWLIETRGVTSAPETPSRSAAILLAVGVAILVMTPPSHTWITAAADESHPLAVVLLACTLQVSGLLFLISLLESYAWIRTEGLVFSGLRAAGMLMILVGAVSCAGERRLTRVLGYSILIDFGVSLLAAASGTLAGMATALGMAAARIVSATVFAMGVADGRSAGGGTPDGRSAPSRMGRLATLVGGLGLAGLPLAPGFPGRWMVLSAGGDVLTVLAVTAGTLVVAVAVVRQVGTLTPRSSEANALGEARRDDRLMAGGVAAVVALGVFPTLAYGWALPALATLARFLPGAGP